MNSRILFRGRVFNAKAGRRSRVTATRSIDWYWRSSFSTSSAGRWVSFAIPSTVLRSHLLSSSAPSTFRHLSSRLVGIEPCPTQGYSPAITVHLCRHFHEHKRTPLLSHDAGQAGTELQGRWVAWSLGRLVASLARQQYRPPPSKPQCITRWGWTPRSAARSRAALTRTQDAPCTESARPAAEGQPAPTRFHRRTPGRRSRQRNPPAQRSR